MKDKFKQGMVMTICARNNVGLSDAVPEVFKNWDNSDLSVFNAWFLV